MVSHAQSAKLVEEACRFIPGGVNTSLRKIEPSLVFARAEGARIYDADGNEYIDFHGAFGPIILGHRFPAVNQKVVEAIGELDLFGVGITELEIRLAEKIVQHLPSAERALICNTGSEATHHAVRVSRAVTGRQKLIKFQGCFHGWHDYLLRNIVSPPDKIGKRDPASAGMLEEAIDNTIVCTFNDLDSVEQAVKENRGEIAAIILEPIPHNIGCVLPRPGFLEGLRKITQDHDIILIFDEVITGFRHNLGGYQRICGVTPDLTTMGKAIANGFPIAAIAGKEEIMNRFATKPGGDVFFSGTYNGHPVGTAAALATIEVLETQPVHDHIFRLGDKMRKGLQEIMERLGIKATVTGFGSVFLTLFMEGPINNYSDLIRNDAQMFISYRQRLLDRGIFKLPYNLKRNHISFSHTDADIEETLQACEDTLKELR